MAKKGEELNFDLDDTIEEQIEVLPSAKELSKPKEESKEIKKINNPSNETYISCLRNERICVRYIPKLEGIWGNNPKHVLAGGMAETASRTFVVPRLTSGAFVNVLTDNEKAFLEDIMGLEYNALSIYKKNDNFWSDATEGGIGKVRLLKQDNYLDLSDPKDYIKYKILLANKDHIAPSLQDLQEHKKATYQYVIVSENAETSIAKSQLNTTMQCYKEFGKIEDDAFMLRTILEMIEGRPTSSTTKIEFLQTKVNTLIQANSALFLKIVKDALLPTKVLIKKCIEDKLISNRGNLLYLTSDGTPLCENNEDPTLDNAAKFLNSPKRQTIKFMLEAKLKE